MRIYGVAMGDRQAAGAFGIPVPLIEKAYADRSMDRWSDHRLGRSIGEVVQRPRVGEFDSFVLHAPLEIAARSALLAHVSGKAKRLARLRLVSVAARYEAFGPAVGPVSSPPPAEPIPSLIDAVTNGDADGAEAAALALADALDRREVVEATAEFVIPLTSAAAHASIFLHLLQRSDPRGPITARLLAPLARELARDTGKSIRWVEGWTGNGPTDAALLERTLMTTPVQRTESGFIHPIMSSVDSSGLARGRLSDVVGSFDAEAAGAVLRVAARSMIEDTGDHAPYGWSHCLTIPQAVLEIASSSGRPDIALAVAATHVLGFRAALGEAELSDRPVAAYEPSEDLAVTIDAAASHHDAHVAKYVLACIDAAAFDPAAEKLYHSAAAHLLEVWSERTVENDPLENQSSSMSV